MSFAFAYQDMIGVLCRYPTLLFYKVFYKEMEMEMEKHFLALFDTLHIYGIQQACDMI